MKITVLVAFVWVLSLGGCAHAPAKGSGPDRTVCPAVPMQGNGGAADRCGQVPAGCICQQM